MGSEDAYRLASFVAGQREELVALAYLLTGRREDAQDAVHEVFARLLASDLSGVADLRSYVRRAVANECASWGRRRVRYGRRARLLEAEWQRTLSTRPDPFGRVEVMSALSVLSQRQRTAVVLRYFLSLDDEEIAGVIGCAPATVRSLLSRALRTLRNDLRNGDEANG